MEATPSINPVLDSAQLVCGLATHVAICQSAIDATVARLSVADVNEITSPKAFDEDLHFNDGGPLTAQYLLVVDALNFCFWPDSELEYEHMSKGVKAAVLRDPSSISAERLANITGDDVHGFFGFPGREVPLQEERARLLREVGRGLLQHFGGQASRLVEAANHSALALVQLVAMHFPGFRDHAVYKGRQVFLYKRAQIFAGDLFGAFQGQGLGRFDDLHLITMFADYRVPVVLHIMGILQYSEPLQAKIQQRQLLAPGSEEEVELRAATVVAVERLTQAIAARFARCATSGVGQTAVAMQTTAAGLDGREGGGGGGSEAGCSGSEGAACAVSKLRSPSPMECGGGGEEGQTAAATTAHAGASAAVVGGEVASVGFGPTEAGSQRGEGKKEVLERGVPCAVQLDWWLWHQGERERQRHPPQHQTLTIFY